MRFVFFFFFQAEDGIRDLTVTGVQTCALPILPPPPRPVDGGGIKRLRRRLKMSQAVFARCLNVSTKLVQAWEAGRRTPDGPALLLVRLVDKNPALLLSSWTLVKRRLALAKRGFRNVTRGRRTRQPA